MDVDSSSPPGQTAHPLTNSTLPAPVELPPSPPDTISDIRKTMMDGDSRAQADTPGMDVDTPEPAAAALTNAADALQNGNGDGGVSTPQTNRISLKLRHPAINADLTGGESSGPSRASTPGSGTGPRKRRGYVHHAHPLCTAVSQPRLTPPLADVAFDLPLTRLPNGASAD